MREALSRMVIIAEQTIGTTLLTIQELAQKRCLSKAKGIIKDPTHPGHKLFSPLPLVGGTAV